MNHSSQAAVLPAAAQEAAKTARQIVAVRYLSGSKAELSYYKATGESWTLVFSCDANVGKNGVGKTREGDMKTPLGTFALSTPFGILPDPSADDPAGRVVENYLQLTDQHYWCGQNGPYYNRLIDNARPPEGYSPSPADEHLIRYDPSYRYSMFVEYNIEGVPSLGSAIFLHCTSANPHTAGCVAVAEPFMRELILELKPGAVMVVFE